MTATTYDCYLGPFDYEHKNPPPPFNPNYHPMSKTAFKSVIERLWQDEDFKALSQEDRSEAIKREYEYEMKNYK